MGGSAPNNNVNLAAQAYQAQKAQALQQQQWQAEQAATNQAAQVAQQQANQSTAQQSTQNATQQQQFNALNAGQGQAVDATGGPAGIKAAATFQNNTAGLSPAQMKLQAAGIAANPTSLSSLMQKRSANSAAPLAPGGLLSSTNVRLGG